MSPAPTVSVNGEARPVLEDATLLALIREMGLAEKKGVAVAVNGAVVPRRDWPARAIAGNDRVLVIQATQGG